jgi:hypothetical protein
MADATIITFENSLNRATIFQTQLADSKLRMLQNILVGPGTNRTTLLANEDNFTGYPTGGYNLAAWAGPGLVPTGGAVLTSPQVQVEVVPVNGVVAVTNQLTGWWVETTNGATLIAGSFSPNRSMAVPTDQFPLTVQDIEGAVAPPPAS